jgi:hypothetical protein
VFDAAFHRPGIAFRSEGDRVRWGRPRITAMAAEMTASNSGGNVSTARAGFGAATMVAGTTGAATTGATGAGTIGAIGTGWRGAGAVGLARETHRW